MFKVNNKDTKKTPVSILYPPKTPEKVWKTSFWCLYCSLWTYFTLCSSVSIVNFEQVSAGWESYKKDKHIRYKYLSLYQIFICNPQNKIIFTKTWYFQDTFMVPQYFQVFSFSDRIAFLSYYNAIALFDLFRCHMPHYNIVQFF